MRGEGSNFSSNRSCLGDLPTPICNSGRKPGLVCEEAGILTFRTRWQWLEQSEGTFWDGYHFSTHTPAGQEWGRMALGRWGRHRSLSPEFILNFVAGILRMPLALLLYILAFHNSLTFPAIDTDWLPCSLVLKLKSLKFLSNSRPVGEEDVSFWPQLGGHHSRSPLVSIN